MPPGRIVLKNILLCALVLPILAPSGVLARDQKLVSCRMTFNLKGWSAFYKTAQGDGTITCDDGQTARVRIKAKGGGITFGKSEIVGGTGRFTGARSINELFGSYAQSEAHAGAGKSADAQALTKGEVSLALHGTGRGLDIGFAFGKFTIEKAK
ncbi:MAG TPA: hypothetical protein VEW47_04185 [Candidatus Dormibacteraeota bacterium]|nr:hypothetical protein [Candidatus Dormibacteraeota bacterium]